MSKVLASANIHIAPNDTILARIWQLNLVGLAITRNRFASLAILERLCADVSGDAGPDDESTRPGSIGAVLGDAFGQASLGGVSDGGADAGGDDVFEVVYAEVDANLYGHASRETLTVVDLTCWRGRSA